MWEKQSDNEKKSQKVSQVWQKRRRWIKGVFKGDNRESIHAWYAGFYMSMPIITFMSHHYNSFPDNNNDHHTHCNPNFHVTNPLTRLILNSTSSLFFPSRKSGGFNPQKCGFYCFERYQKKTCYGMRSHEQNKTGKGGSSSSP